MKKFIVNLLAVVGVLAIIATVTVFVFFPDILDKEASKPVVVVGEQTTNPEPKEISISETSPLENTALNEIDYKKILPTDIIVGDKNAPLSIIIYSSFSCPHCAHLHNEVLPLIDEYYVKTGKVNYVHRSIAFDKIAYSATVLAHCVNKEYYVDFVNLLFNKQSDWIFADNYMDKLKKYGSVVGVTEEKYNQCLNDENFEKSFLTAQQQAVHKLQIKGVPILIIEGEVVSGAPDYHKLSTTIDKHLQDKYYANNQ